MSEINPVEVVNAKPDARHKIMRAQVEYAVVNEHDDVVGFVINFSRRKELCTTWVRVGVPDGSEVRRYD